MCFPSLGVYLRGSSDMPHSVVDMEHQNPPPNSEDIKCTCSWPLLVLAVPLIAVTGNAVAAWTLYSYRLVYPIYPILSTLIFFLSLITITISILLRRSKVCGSEFESRAAKIERISRPLSRVSKEDLLRATHDFDDRNVIGRGRFGRVYKGLLPNGRTVAVKRFQVGEDAAFSAKHFLSELKILGQLRHRNLLRILGYFYNTNEMSLILEFMPNGSLDGLLHCRRGRCRLEWRQRLNIAVGVASGLAYLHHECKELVIHCDVKPSNILLDENLEARIADFGAAKLNGDAMFTESSFGSHCTIGYAAPERAYEMRPSAKGDVYSFGILLLELITGEKPTSWRFGEGVSLPQWVKMENTVIGNSGNLMLVDDCLKSNSSEFQEEIQRAIDIAILCTNQCPRMRPEMKDVVKALVKITDEGRLAQFNIPLYVLAHQKSQRHSRVTSMASASTSTSAS